MKTSTIRAAAALLAVGSLAAAGCGSSSTKSSTATTAAGPPTTVGTTSASSFDLSFSAMTALKSLAGQGSGKIGVILPDTTSSARYVEFDAPYLAKAFQTAGLQQSDYTIQNSQGSDATALTDAQADITNGAKVLLIDPEDPAGGVAIENYAKAHGVDTIDYDRLTLGGSRNYYVSFNNVEVGTLIGKGLVSCIGAWNVPNPQVIVMHGSATDNNATLFAQGYNAVMAPYFTSGKWTNLASTADTWTPADALTEFQQAYTAHKTANAVLVPNDETGAPIVSYLQTQGIKAKTFPLTGQDATLVGLQNVLSGYQCGTAYKPIYEEAQAGAALALYLRAGKTPPSGLVNGSSQDTSSNMTVPSVLLTPEWVTTANMDSTIIKDNFVPANQCVSTSSPPSARRMGFPDHGIDARSQRSGHPERRLRCPARSSGPGIRRYRR
ncbi:MAG: sugar ABC transporter substrate-binding protein [Acidimicrobiales bacterium]